MSEQDDKCFLCSQCGKINEEPPYECPEGGELDATFDSDEYYIEDGYLHWHGYCDESGDVIVLRKHEFFIDAANTASFIRRYAEGKGWDVSIEWISTEDGNGRMVDRVAIFGVEALPNPHFILGQYYTKCLERLTEYMESQSA